jgi:hypothetical protein
MQFYTVRFLFKQSVKFKTRYVSSKISQNFVIAVDFRKVIQYVASPTRKIVQHRPRKYCDIKEAYFIVYAFGTIRYVVANPYLDFREITVKSLSISVYCVKFKTRYVSSKISQNFVIAVDFRKVIQYVVKYYKNLIFF